MVPTLSRCVSRPMLVNGTQIGRPSRLQRDSRVTVIESSESSRKGSLLMKSTSLIRRFSNSTSSGNCSAAPPLAAHPPSAARTANRGTAPHALRTNRHDLAVVVFGTVSDLVSIGCPPLQGIRQSQLTSRLHPPPTEGVRAPSGAGRRVDAIPRGPYVSALLSRPV